VFRTCWVFLLVWLVTFSCYAQSKPLRWGADAEGGAPFVFKDPHNPNSVIGFEVDLAQELSKELAQPINFVQYNYKSLQLGVQRGDLDFAMNGIEATEQRTKSMRLSRPYYYYTLQLVVRNNERRFTDLDSCKTISCTVGTMEETAAEQLLTKLQLPKKVYEGQVEPYSELALGRIDAVLLDTPIAVYYGKPNQRLRFQGSAFAPGAYALMFAPKNQALANRFDRALEDLSRNGKLRNIYEKWGIWNSTQQRLVPSGVHPPPRLSSATASAPQPSISVPPASVFTEQNPTDFQSWTWKRYLPLLLEASWVTIYLSLYSMGLAMLLGLLLASARLFGPTPVRWLAVVYVEFFRGIPLLLLLYFLYYGLPQIADTYHLFVRFRFSPMQVAVVGCGMNYAAYEAEVYRAGILSVPHSQWEAAASLGMSRAQIFRRIIAPQAIRIILPSSTNDFISLFKDTSLVSVIAVVELSKQYQILSKSSMKYLEIGAATACLYLLMSVPLAWLSRRLEHSWSQGQDVIS
jgi:polar amino acid transport system substrate-binding protein